MICRRLLERSCYFRGMTATTKRPAGERTRRAILAASAALATTEGIDGLSIGRLADHLGMSKSGLFAHFGSKEELQLATIAAARELFEAEVVAPTLGEPTARGRIEALCERFLSHVERRVFPGGCFFAAVGAELDTRPGRVRDAVAAVERDWMSLIEGLAAEARDAGDLAPSEDPAQVAFELEAFLLLANNRFVLEGEPAALERGRRAIRRRLAYRG
jgi:AcrR family transcriptional regulator